MAVSPENTRRTVTLPTALVERLKREQGGGHTLSDVLRLKLEQAYVGMDAQIATLTQRVEQVSGEVAVIRAVLEQLVGMFEAWAKTSAPTAEPEVPLRVVSYEEMYGPITPPAVSDPPAPPVEPKPRKRWPW
jgi:hypothetical protein